MTVCLRRSLVVLASLIAIGVTAGGGASAAGLASSTQPSDEVGVVAIGDFGVGGDQQRTMGASLRRFAAVNRVDLLVTLGDNWYGETVGGFLRSWEESFGWIEGEGIDVAGSLGNHDNDAQPGARYQFEPLNMPGPYYTRQLGEAEFFILDSTDVTPQQTQWLRERLVRSTATWKIAVAHHPPYTCGRHEPDDDVIREWVPLFERYGVALVLAGHDHNYQRFGPRRGVTYVVSGGGGKDLYELTGCPTSLPTRRVAERRYHFLHLLISLDRIKIQAVHLQEGQHLDGLVLDSFELTRAGALADRPHGRRSEVSHALSIGVPFLAGTLILGLLIAALGLVGRRAEVVVVGVALPVAAAIGVGAVAWLL